MSGLALSFTKESFSLLFKLLLTFGPLHPRCNIFTIGKPSFDSVSVIRFSRSSLVHDLGKQVIDTSELSCHQICSSTEHGYRIASISDLLLFHQPASGTMHFAITNTSFIEVWPETKCHAIGSFGSTEVHIMCKRITEWSMKNYDQVFTRCKRLVMLNQSKQMKNFSSGDLLFLWPYNFLVTFHGDWLSRMRCRLAYSPADATATHYL